MEDKRVKIVFVASLIVYSLIYMALTGMLRLTRVYTSEPVTVELVRQSVTGLPSMLMVVILGRLVLTITPLGTIFFLALSILFALNIALLYRVYIKRMGALMEGKRVFLASTPAMFTPLACAAGCGGGASAALISLASSIAGAGSASLLASLLTKWGWMLSTLSIVLLSWSLYKVSELTLQAQGYSLRIDIPRRGFRLE